MVAGYVVDPSGRALAAAGYSVRKIASVMGAQFGRRFWPMPFHRTLHHLLYLTPPTEDLRIVPQSVVLKALAGLGQAQGRPAPTCRLAGA